MAAACKHLLLSLSSPQLRPIPTYLSYLNAEILSEGKKARQRGKEAGKRIGISAARPATLHPFEVREK